MQLTDPREAEKKVAARYQTMLILWIAMWASLFIFIVLSFVIPSSATPDRTLSMVLLAISFVAVIVSLLLKTYLLRRAIEKQELQMLVNAYVTGFALIDASAILALLDHMVNNSRYFYFAFIVAGIGLLLHFPKKDHVRALS